MALKVFRFDASGCNGCDIEILSTILNPEYGVKGIEVVDSPEKAGAMIVTGGGNVKTAEPLKHAFAQLQEPKLVISMGACASSMCVFKDGYSMKGPVDFLIPVNYFVLGCPPRPQNLAMAIHALLKDETDHTGPVWIGPDGLRSRIVHDREKCTACGACANMCPSGAIDIEPDGEKFHITFNLWKCSFCGTCQQVCPEDAVKLTQDYAIQGMDKLSQIVEGAMLRTMCTVCGRPHISNAQVNAVCSRIIHNSPELEHNTNEVNQSLLTCPECKAIIHHQARTRKHMVEWAYKK